MNQHRIAALVAALLLLSLTPAAHAETLNGLQLSGAESAVLENEVIFTAPIVLAGRSSLTIRDAAIQFEGTEALFTVTESATLTITGSKLEAAQTRLRVKDDARANLSALQ
jgi:hypothetical protein